MKSIFALTAALVPGIWIGLLGEHVRADPPEGNAGDPDDR